jgi:hypothetical protein
LLTTFPGDSPVPARIYSVSRAQWCRCVICSTSSAQAGCSPTHARTRQTHNCPPFPVVPD